jgi:DNA-directed RNA polymerase specialized sigma24 family protein
VARNDEIFPPQPFQRAPPLREAEFALARRIFGLKSRAASVTRRVAQCAMRNRASLSGAHLEALLSWLAPTASEAGERYVAIRRALNRFFVARRCVPPDEYSDDTLDRVGRRLAAGERIQAASPGTYVYGVARNVYREAVRRHPTEVPLARGSEPTVRYVEAPPGVVCFRRCLERLSPDARELLEAYYLDGREALAEKLGVTPNAIRLRVFKQKQALKTCIRQCLERNEAVPQGK